MPTIRQLPPAVNPSDTDAVMVEQADGGTRYEFPSDIVNSGLLNANLSVFSTFFTSWLQSLPVYQPTSGWWNSSGTPTYSYFYQTFDSWFNSLPSGITPPLNGWWNNGGSPQFIGTTNNYSSTFDYEISTWIISLSTSPVLVGWWNNGGFPVYSGILSNQDIPGSIGYAMTSWISTLSTSIISGWWNNSGTPVYS